MPSRARAVYVAAGLLVVGLAAVPARRALSQAPAASPVTFFGELRARTEWDRPGGSVDADAFTYLRTRIGLRTSPAENVALVFQLQDSRVYGAASTTASIFGLHQGYVDLSTNWRGTAVTTRVGRQEVALGNERLVGVVNWSNTGRTFDAARVLLAPRGAATGAEPWTATAFIATVDERGRRFGEPPASPEQSTLDRTAIGAFASRTHEAGTFDATILYDAGAAYRAYASSDRVTIDARFRTAESARIGIELEAAFQGGNQRVTPTGAMTSSVQDVRAWLAGVRAGAFPRKGRRTSAFVGADVLSGDPSPQDATYSGFATLYATNHSRYGLMDLFGDPNSRTGERGLVDALAMINTELTERAQLHGELHRYAAQAGDSREIGWELDITIPMRLSPAASFEVGYGAFRAGPGASTIGLGAAGTSRHWAYAMLRTAF